MKMSLFTTALVLLLASPSFAELEYTRFTIRFGLTDPRSWGIVNPPLPYEEPSMLNPVDKAAAKKLDDLNKSVTYSCLLLQSPDYRVSGNFGDYLNIFEVKKCNEVRANLAPVGSNAFCSTPCAQELSSCSPELECWANPASRQFLCCDGQPSASFVPALPPDGSNADCPTPCALDASCPPELECWANPIDHQFRCCDGRPT